MRQSLSWSSGGDATGGANARASRMSRRMSNRGHATTIASVNMSSESRSSGGGGGGGVAGVSLELAVSGGDSADEVGQERL